MYYRRHPIYSYPDHLFYRDSYIITTHPLFGRHILLSVDNQHIISYHHTIFPYTPVITRPHSTIIAHPSHIQTPSRVSIHPSSLFINSRCFYQTVSSFFISTFSFWDLPSLKNILGGVLALLGSWTLGSLGPWTLGPLDPWTLGPLDPWCSRPLDPWCSRPLDPWCSRPLDPWCSRPLDPWCSRPLDPWCSRPLDPWCSRPLDPWTLGPLVLSALGPLDPWTLGALGPWATGVTRPLGSWVPGHWALVDMGSQPTSGGGWWGLIWHTDTPCGG
jgi:hypothetical protein